MNMQLFTLTAAGALTAAASADYIGISADITQNFNGTGLTQYRFYAHFDAPDDYFNVIGGDRGIDVDFVMGTDDPEGFHQQGSAFDPIWGWDIANAYTFTNPAGELDTWIGIGEVGLLSWQGFMDGLGGHVGALPYARAVDGGAFATENHVGVSAVTIANFVVHDGYDVEFGGVIGWDDSDLPNGVLSMFYYNNMTPAPSALALFTLASLAASRRRRT
jgi:hypothetical protein